jgi:hypothetical protein
MAVLQCVKALCAELTLVHAFGETGVIIEREEVKRKSNGHDPF